MNNKRKSGIYLIKIVPLNKVYIGESVDLDARWKRYVWAANSEKSYYETKRTIVKLIREYGLDNVEFIILESGKKHKDAEYRKEREKYYINKYKSYIPEYGFNLTKGGEPGPSRARKQSIAEKLKRSKPLVVYDILTDNATLYIGGAKSVGDTFGTSKDIISHTVQRGSKFAERYYMIPLSKDKQDSIINKLTKKKLENYDQSGRARSHSRNAFNSYIDAVNRVNKLMRQ